MVTSNNPSEHLYTKAKSQKPIQQAPISLSFAGGVRQRKTDGDKPLLHEHTWELREVVGLGLHNIAHAREQDVRDLVLCLACQSTLGVTHCKTHDLLNRRLGLWKLPPLRKQPTQLVVLSSCTDRHDAELLRRV